MSNRSAKFIEESWKRKTSAANDLFLADQLPEALVLYLEALRLAEWLVEQATDGLLADIPVIHMFVISCNNLFNTYVGLNDYVLAEAMLRRNVYFLLHQNSLHKTDTSLQHEIRNAFLAYALFCRKTNSGDPESLLTELKSQSFSFDL